MKCHWLRTPEAVAPSARAERGSALPHLLLPPPSPAESRNVIQTRVGHFHCARQRRLVYRLPWIVSHCMLDGLSAPPRASGMMWSTTYLGPLCGYPVIRFNSVTAHRLQPPTSFRESHQEIGGRVSQVVSLSWNTRFFQCSSRTFSRNHSSLWVIRSRLGCRNAITTTPQ